MKTLHLPLKAKWYEMIDSGEKTEEYREIKPYWINRFTEPLKIGLPLLHHPLLPHNRSGRAYDAVKFSYGYTKRAMTFEIKSISIGKGKTEWGAPGEEVFVIKLGKRV